LPTIAARDLLRLIEMSANGCQLIRKSGEGTVARTFAA